MVALASDQRVRYLAVGGINTVAGYVVFSVVQLLFGHVISYLGSVLVSHAITSTVAFVLYRRLVFRVSGHTLVDFVRFQSVYLIPLVANLLALPALVGIAGWNVYVAQASIVVVTVIVSYVGHKYFSFRRGRAPALEGSRAAETGESTVEGHGARSPGAVLAYWSNRPATVYAATAVASSIATVKALRLWVPDWSVPFYYGTDAVLSQAGFKTVVETGWYEEQPLLGAPHGQVFYDWKISDNLGYLFPFIGRFFTHDANLLLNLYFVLGFPAAALAAAWFLRRVGVSGPMTVALATLYALAPYHFLRGENHLFLATYYSIPLALGVVWWILSGQPLWSPRAGLTGWRRWVGGRWLATAVILAVVASNNTYYGVFTILLIAFAGLIALIRSHSWRRFLGAVSAGVFTLVVALLNMLPPALYSLRMGTNEYAVQRFPQAVETYSLTFAQLVLPMLNHRIPFFTQLRQFYIANFPPEGEGPLLGLVAAFGFVALFAAGLYLVAGPRKGHRESDTPERRAAIGALAALTLFTFVLATWGGLSTLIGFVTSDLRGWNRIVIVIAMLALAGSGLIVDATLGRLLRRRSRTTATRPIVVAVVALAVLVVGYLDQVGPVTTPPYALTQSLYAADQRLVDGISASAGPKASILQLPYRDFPESAPINNVPDTDQLKPYVHSDTLTWSGGGIKGRPFSEWVRALERLPARDIATAAHAAGFSGVLLDTQAYVGNRGRKEASALEDSLGAPAVESDDARYRYYSFDPIASADRARYSSAELRAIGDEVVHPVIARIQPDVTTGFDGPELLKPYRPRIMLESNRDTPVTVTVHFTFSTDVPPRTFRFTAPDGSTQDVRTTRSHRGVVDLRTVVQPGRSWIDITVIDGAPLPTRIHQVTSISATRIDVVDVQLLRRLGLSQDQLSG
ncbi:MAG: GtrA family protein [Gordonia polyisoprenivorans]|nr:GtrA family protein [Gordonia polyisoprenivorans]